MIDNTIPFSNPETARAFHKKYKGRSCYKLLLALTREQVLKRIQQVAKTTCFPPPEAEVASMVRLLDNIKIKVRLPANSCKPETLITMKVPVGECLGSTMMLRRAAEETFFKREISRGRTFPAFVFPGIARQNSGVGYYAYTSRAGHIRSIDPESVAVRCPGEYSLPGCGFHCTVEGAIATTVIIEPDRTGYYLSEGKWVRETTRERLTSAKGTADRIVLDLCRDALVHAKKRVWEATPPQRRALIRKAVLAKGFAYFLCILAYGLMTGASLMYPEYARLTHDEAVFGAVSALLAVGLFFFVESL